MTVSYCSTMQCKNTFATFPLMLSLPFSSTFSIGHRVKYVKRELSSLVVDVLTNVPSGISFREMFLDTRGSYNAVSTTHEVIERKNY